MYKVISWVTFKTQCEQSDEILRTTFQCSDDKVTSSSSAEQSSTDYPPPNTVNNLLQSNAVDAATIDTVECQLEQSTELVLADIDEWNASDVRPENNEISAVYVKLDDDDDADEVDKVRLT